MKLSARRFSSVATRLFSAFDEEIYLDFPQQPLLQEQEPPLLHLRENESKRDLFAHTHTWHGEFRLRDAKKRNKKASGSGEVHPCRVAIERAFYTCGVPGPEERMNFYPHPGKHGRNKTVWARSK